MYVLLFNRCGVELEWPSCANATDNTASSNHGFDVVVAAASAGANAATADASSNHFGRRQQ
jgi:hypothetical protein